MTNSVRWTFRLADAAFLFQFLHSQHIPVLGELFQNAVLQAVALAAQEKAVLILIEVAAVGQGEEGVSHAVCVGDVLEQPLTVQKSGMDSPSYSGWT